MIERTYIQLTEEEKKRFEETIAENKKILEIKFKKFTVFLLIIIELIILYLIYLFEENGFSVILKLLTIVPIWGIIMITYLYYQKYIPAKKLFNLHSGILNEEKYQAIRIKSNYCEKYSDRIADYFLFIVQPEIIVLFRKQDFEIDETIFPNNNFIIPPFELREIIGNKILCEGQLMKPENEKTSQITKYLNAMNLLETGQVFIQSKI
ncbi:MAG: hypothetical protein RBT49_13330 [Bacteroidales bacterium]|jgi:hypothetical protein|nr:hypothetical protein [Bacteroidales bacterium]